LNHSLTSISPVSNSKAPSPSMSLSTLLPIQKESNRVLIGVSILMSFELHSATRRKR
jgi:hypothetical protein